MMADNFQSRRPILKRVRAGDAENAGLWLDKYMDQDVPPDAEKPEKTLVHDVARIPVSVEYEQFYKRWEQLLEAKCPISPKEAKVEGRLAVGLGMESVLETSISLHRTYGVPYIPGSALKGLAAHYARNYLDEGDWHKKSEAYITLFGNTDSAGYITFYDALYVPGSGYKKQALWPDIITVHHPEYYQGQSKPPADWDNPTPIHFVSATGKYLIALDGPEAWVEKAFEILGYALPELGVGAKTSSGYGRITLDGMESSQPTGISPTTPSDVPSKPSKDWDWRKGKTTRDGRHVADADNPDSGLRFEKAFVLPKGFTPGGKKDVDYAIEILPDGSQRVWVKRRFYPIQD